MREITYIARLSYCDDGVCVNFPDVPGALTFGETREHAIEMAKDALVCWFLDDTPLPPSRRIDELEKIPEIRHDSTYAEVENRYEFVEVSACLDDDACDGTNGDEEYWHYKYAHPDGRCIIVPRHGGERYLPVGTLNEIKKLYEG